MSLVSLFVPLVAGLFFKVRNEAAALLSIVAGLVSWLIFNFQVELPIPSHISATLVSLVGMLIGIAVFGKEAAKKKPAV